MEPSKFVLKCGKFAVLVDLHILPLGSQESSSWFSQQHKEEVGDLIRESVETRVKQFLEARQGHSKQRKELSPEDPVILKGQTLRLAAYFMKRHVNLRCIIRQCYRELRVFPERFVVCVSLLENAMAPVRNLNLNVMEQSGQSRSGYFSGPGETQDPLNSSTITKKAALQKIARQADAHPQSGPEHKIQHQEQIQGANLTQPSINVAELRVKEEVGLVTKSVAGEKNIVKEVSVQSDHEEGKMSNGSHVEIEQQCYLTEGCLEKAEDAQVSQFVTQDHNMIGRRRRRTPSSPMEDFDNHEAKRVCRGELLVGARVDSDSTTTSSLSSTQSCPSAAQAELVLEEELLTHGKQAPSLPLSQNTAKQTNQSRLAASLRSLSVKAVSSGSSISSRTTANEEESVSAPRISRLRRIKKS